MAGSAKKTKDKSAAKHMLCRAHAWRVFVQACDVAKSPEVKEAIGVVRELFDLEDKLKEFSHQVCQPTGERGRTDFYVA